MSCVRGCLPADPAPTVWAFLHGVGSFDPLPDAVLLWTRITPPGPASTPTPAAGPKPAKSAANGAPSVPVLQAHALAGVQVEVPVHWSLSPCSDFSKDVQSGTYLTSAERDFTVCVDAAGLQPATRYFYKFSCNGATSATGTTKTAAFGRLEEMKVGVVSCANWGFGFFNVYDLAARVDGLDLIVHLGDYIYEYEKGNYPERWQQARHGLRPKEYACEFLSDYRARYACYRTDPALQELHRKLPMVAVWDDHEISDSSYMTGSDDFEGSAQEFQEKKAQGLQAYAEWVPIRGLNPQRPDPAAAHRIFHFGDLFTLIMLENRISNRTKPLDIASTKFYAEVAKKPMKVWDEGKIEQAREELMVEMRDENRKMIGQQQVDAVGAAVRESVEAGRPWQLIASGTVLSEIKAPRLLETLPLQPGILRFICRTALRVACAAKIAGQEAAEQARLYLGMGRYAVPMNPDAWDGYQAERTKVLDALNVPKSNPVILAGDSHNAWAHELIDTEGNRLGVEFDGPAVTSIGAFEDIYSRFESKFGRLMRLWPVYLFTPWVQDSLQAANPATLRYCNLSERGLIVLHLTRRRCHAEFHYVGRVTRPQYKNYCEAAYYAEVGERGRLHKGSRYLTVDGVLPKRTRRKRAGLIQGIHDVYKGPS